MIRLNNALLTAVGIIEIIEEIDNQDYKQTAIVRLKEKLKQIYFERFVGCDLLLKNLPVTHIDIASLEKKVSLVQQGDVFFLYGPAENNEWSLLELDSELISNHGLLFPTKEAEANELKYDFRYDSLFKYIHLKNKKINFDKRPTDAQIIEILDLDTRFNSGYSHLKYVLNVIFSSKNTAGKSDFLEDIKSFQSCDWDASQAQEHLKTLDAQYGYFRERDDEVLPLFKKLAIACRVIIVFIEQNNTPDDKMAYEYAYKLMALSNGLSFDEVSKFTFDMMNASNETGNVFHDALLVKLHLPHFDDVNDRIGWLNFIKKYGIVALPRFSIANTIEQKIKEKTQVLRAPQTLQEAKEIEILCQFKRAEEDHEFAVLWKKYRMNDENCFNACLDYMKEAPGWPKKDTDFLPYAEDLIIPEGRDIYRWVKLSPSDKHSLILGHITGCCQSINYNAEQCVKDAVSLSHNGLYVLLKHKQGDVKKIKNHDGFINNENFQIIGQAYAWLSKTGSLCFDSIECSNGSISDELLHKTLKIFSQDILDKNPNIYRITLGSGGKTPRGIFGDITLTSEIMYEGYSYGDAAQQYCVLARPSSLNLEERDALNSVLTHCPDKFRAHMHYLFDFIPNKLQAIHELEKLLARDPSLAKNFSHEHLANLIFYSQGTPSLKDLEPIDDKAILDELLLGYSEKFKELTYFLCGYSDAEPVIYKKLTNLFNENEASYDKKYTYLDVIEPVLNDFTKNDIERLQILREKSLPRLFCLNSRESIIGTLLLAIDSLHFTPARIFGRPISLHILLRVLPYISEELRFEALTMVDEFGSNALICINDLEVFNRIMNALPEKQRLAAGSTLLNRALSTIHTDLLKAILMIYPEESRYDIVRPYLDGFYKYHPSCFLAMLQVLTTDQINLFFDEDILCNWSMYKVFFPIIRSIFALLPEGKNASEIITKTDQYGHSILERSLNEDTIEGYLCCLQFVPIEQRISFLNQRRFWANTIYCGDNLNNLAAISSILQPKDFLSVLQQPCEKKTVAILYLEYFEHNQQDCFYRILHMLPSELRIEATKIILLNCAEYSPKILKSFAAVIPDIYLEIFSEKDEAGAIPFFSSIKTSEILVNILRALPQKISNLIFIDDIKKTVLPMLNQIDIYNKETLAKLMSEIQLSQDLSIFCNHLEKLSLAIQEDNRSKVEQRLIVRNNERRLIVRDQERTDVFFKIKERIASDRNSDITENNNDVKPG